MCKVFNSILRVSESLTLQHSSSYSKVKVLMGGFFGMIMTDAFDKLTFLCLLSTVGFQI